MAITHRISASVFQSGTGNRPVAPHADTAVGELMVLLVGFQDSAATTVSTPTGWTVKKAVVTTGTLKTVIFTRIREAGDTAWTFAPNQSVETSHVVLSLPGADAASLIVGADGTRAASGGANSTTAPSITTAAPGSRAFILATERTTANETAEATVNNGFTKISHTFQNGTSAESIFLGYKDIATPGPVGATSVAFQNSQGSNGYAVLIAVAPAAVGTSPRGFDSVAQMRATRGATWAHRGGSASYTEHSMYAYAQAAARGYGALELSMQRTSDGVWFGCHDLDLFRVTGGAAPATDVRTMTWAQVNAYQMTIGASGAPQPFMRWQDFLAAGYQNTHVLILDPKNSIGSHQAEFLAMVAGDVSKDRVLMKWSGGQTSFATAARAAGFQTAGYWYQADYDANRLAAETPYWDWLGMDLNAGTAWTGPGSIVELAAAQGKKVWGHIAANQADYNTAMAKGADVVQSAGVASITAVGPSTLGATGTLLLTGSASRTLDVARAATANLPIVGAASRSIDTARDAVGALEVVGAASRMAGVERSATGVLAIDANAEHTRDVVRTAAGILDLTGSGEIRSDGLERTAVGTLVLAGAAARTIDVSREAVDGPTLGGGGSARADVSRAASGELQLRGVGITQHADPFPAHRTLTPLVESRTLDHVLISRTLEDA